MEILTLYENKIQELKNIDALKNLEIFSIGRNEISDEKCVSAIKNVSKMLSFINLKWVELFQVKC